MAVSGSTDEAKPTVPKFSSFKAKDTDIVASAKSRGSKTEDGKIGSPRGGHRPETRDHRSRHHRRHSRDTSRSRPRHEDSSRRRHRSPELVAEHKEPERSNISSIFVIDTRGDPLISKYGGIDRAQIPSYHRHGGGRILGTAGRLFIHRDGARDEFSLRFPGDGVRSSHRDGLRSKSLRITRDSIRIRPGKGAAHEDEPQDDGFLQIRSLKNRKRQRGQSDFSDDERPSYRSIEGKAKSRNFDDESDEDSSEDEEAIHIEGDNPLQWKSMQLSKMVKLQPGDIDAWLELVDHQDDLQRLGETIDERASANAARSFSEIKVSMLESALENTRALEDRQAVTVRLMREGMKIWPTKTATKKWTELAGDEESHFELWRAHVDFAMTNIAALNYDDIQRMLLDRLRKVLARPSPSESDYSEAIYVFLRAMRFAHDAGYKELAVASWQALLELNFFRSPDQDEQCMDSFRDFWESEVPRIGDDGAQGWARYVEVSGQVDAPEPQTTHPTKHLPTSDVFKAWGHSEQVHGEWAIMPARTMDDGTEDDPFRVVMFSDIEPWLFTVSESSAGERVKEELMDAFLIFCGLPPRYRSSEWTRLACTDQFTIRSASIKENQSIRSNAVDDNEELQIQRKTPNFDAGNGSLAMSPTVLFSRNNWFNYFGRGSSDADSLTVHMPWVFNTLKQLVHLAGVQSLSLYYLGFTHAFHSSALKTTAKTILKRYPDAAEVYNGYALAESCNGNLDIAEKVISSAVVSPSLCEGALGCQIFFSWSWLELEKGNKLMATVRLCSAVDESIRCSAAHVKSLPPTAILKTRQALQSRIHQALYEGRVEDASSYAECMILWSYLTEEGCLESTSADQGNISASMRIVENMSIEFKSAGYGDTPGHERMLQTGARMLHLNASRGPFRRAYLRDQFSGFLEHFPSNTMFLSLLEWADSSIRVIDETRQLMYDRILIKGRDCITSRFFSVQHELVRGNMNTTRAAYEHALSSDVSKFNVGLWVSYVRFCHQQSSKELRSKTKEVLYRALRHCPWSKEIMMEAFGTVIRDMQSDELRSVYETMASKGLRVHVDLEEYVERWKQGRLNRRN
ncbi:hypothetical protein E4U13_007730 [Claviceps humidiphila]|uniref:DUF1740-domain-containing protein n=1 Tax=Claviceps humidiphila TaxID=1294629 RepID=A0A9P7QAH5_9HYPO|nr:hypothetical protein E4U13_007730 [Claviceps humidiphila]